MGAASWSTAMPGHDSCLARIVDDRPLHDRLRMVAHLGLVAAGPVEDSGTRREAGVEHEFRALQSPVTCFDRRGCNDPSGARTGELATGVESPQFATVDAASGKLAVVGTGNTRGIVKVIDPATSTVQEIPGRNSR